jgi:hypothetical protein
MELGRSFSLSILRQAGAMLYGMDHRIRGHENIVDYARLGSEQLILSINAYFGLSV